MLRRKRHPSVPIHEWGQIAGYSILEISSCLGVSVSTLKKRLFDARRMLKKSLHVADFISVFHDLYEGGTGMLHIVNGDSVAEKLKKGVIKERFWYGEKYILMVPYFDIWMRLRIEDSGRSIWNRL
ncbi:RNA polymerase sigma factor [Paenibacillus thiaminolyticus]|uniref:RNA polymerase sigma factor n=1 Tax=Paenibacillus thiaminolyticus TaxID=49283 RepID=UPI002176056E|nr:hypothetical protein [Paenibacillus thiaminolyticus]